jgi:putative Ca2+/H+ antiporter (TMEM165/GDT1 family)
MSSCSSASWTAEIGDKTQLAVLLFATDPAASKPGTFAAAAGALILATLVAVAVGAYLGAWIPPGRLRALAGAGFIGIGLWMLLTRP